MSDDIFLELGKLSPMIEEIHGAAPTSLSTADRKREKSDHEEMVSTLLLAKSEATNAGRISFKASFRLGQALGMARAYVRRYGHVLD